MQDLFARKHLEEIGDRQDQPAVRSEQPPAFGNRHRSGGIEHEVVPFLQRSERSLLIVDLMIGADCRQERQDFAPRHAGDLGPEKTRDLHRIRADHAGRAVDEYTLPRFELRPIPQEVEGGGAPEQYRCRLIVRNGGWLACHCLGGVLANEFRPGAVPTHAADLVAGREVSDPGADGLDDAGVARPKHRPSLPGDSERQPGERRESFGETPASYPNVPGRHRGSHHPDEHLMRLRLRAGRVRDSQDIRWTVTGGDCSLHTLDSKDQGVGNVIRRTGNRDYRLAPIASAPERSRGAVHRHPGRSKTAPGTGCARSNRVVTPPHSGPSG